MTTLIAEDLLLLLLDDEKGTVPAGLDLRPVLGGAVLVELAMTGAVQLGEKARFWTSPKVEADPGAAPGDPILAAGLAVVAERPRSAQDLVGRLGNGLRDVLTTRLADQGLLRRQDHRVLRLFPRTTWPAADAAHEAQVRQELGAALVQGLQPTQRTAALVALLHAVGRAHKSVPLDGLPAREVKARAKQIADGDWAARAVRDAIDAATAATVAATTAATAAATSGS